MVDMKVFLKSRRDRVVGTVMGHIEKSVNQSLTREQQKELRDVVIDSVNTYHDTVLDLMKSDTADRNNEMLRLLERIDVAMRRTPVA